MASPQGCAHRLLAEGRVGRVEGCSHGTVHLTLGALALRLSPAQLADLAGMLGAAVHQLEACAEAGRQRMLC